MGRTWLRPAGGALLALGLSIAPAAAQGGAGQGAAARDRPELQAQGLRVGSFIARPELAADVGYLSNVFAVNANRQDDIVFGVRSGLSLASDWSRHAVRGRFRSESLFFTEFGTENRTNFTGDLEARIDLGRTTSVGAGAVFRQQVDPRTSPETPLEARTLVEFDSRAAYVFASRAINRLRLSARGERTSFDFTPIETVGDGVLPLDDRDRVVWEARGRIDYAVSPDTRLFFEGLWNRRDFETVPASGIERDSTGQTFLAGFETELGRLLRGEFSVGYLRQDFAEETVGVVAGPAARVALEYFPTRLTTVRLDSTRRVLDTGVELGAGIVASEVNLQLDHELRRSLIVSAGGGWRRLSFRGLERADRFLDAEAGVRYLLNRRVEVGALYRYQTGASTVPTGRDFDLHSARLSLRVRA